MTRTTTLLFTDIEASTRQWEAAAATMSARVEQHFAVLRRAVADHGGEIFATMGDGIAAAFGSVAAAVLAAVDAQRELPSTGLAVRMGIHTGEVERVGDDLRGRPLNRAARIMAAGHGGQILVSNVAAALLGTTAVTLTDLGDHRLRDLADPERLWQVHHPDVPTRFPPIRSAVVQSGGLPVPRSSLVGRDADVERVATLLGYERLVTLTGVGGVGKTRVAVHAAAELLAQFDRVAFVELTDLRDEGAVGDAVTRTLGPAVDALTLLVVDNCEHVIDAAAAAIDDVMGSSPSLSVLATSREALAIEGEHVLVVTALDPATTAVELFLERAAAAGADVRLIERGAIADVCRRLDGIPLAIELAAARAATLGIGAIADALGDRTRSRSPRHGTMRDTIAWSYNLLACHEQRLFRWLAAFPSSGFELDAAIHVGTALGLDDAAATRHLASLVHKHMLVADPASCPVRYRLLETMRAFGLEQLDHSGERAQALTALAHWVATITDLPFADPCSAAVERASRRLEREAESWREAVGVALRAGRGDLAAALCGPPTAFFLLGRHDLADLVRPLLDLCAGPRRRRAVLAALVVSAAGTTDLAQRLAWADEVERIEAVERTGLGSLMRWLTLAWTGDIRGAIEVCVRASLDQHIAPATRDLFVGIAVLDHYSLTDGSPDRDDLVDRAVAVAAVSDVALHRVTCRLGAAWALADDEPDRALELVRLALDDIPAVPAITRLTLPGSAARLLARLDPRVAAQGLLAQLDADTSATSFVDLIPLSYAGALLQRVGHESAGSVLAALAPDARALSMMDVVDGARRAAATSDAVALHELESVVRSALAEIAASD